jgi:hypothetical protein
MEDWSESQKSLHALAAMDFADLPRTHIASAESQLESQRAGESLGVLRNFSFFDKIK